MVKACAGCGLKRRHRRRSDTGKLQGKCRECQAAYLKRWRRERWKRRKAYDTWRGMIRRCHDPSTRRWWPGSGVPNYRDYGELGIKVCRRWRDPEKGFEAFLADMGLPPTKEHTLDRIRPTRGYYRTNCRWADKATQDQNRKNTVWVTARHPVTGETLTLCLSEWGRRTGVDRRVIGRRIRNGWSPDLAVSEPTSAMLEEAPF